VARITRHLRSSAVAYVALFIALGGTSAWAVGEITSQDIRDETIRSIDVRDEQLRSEDVRNDSLTGDDVDESTLAPAPEGDEVAQASGRVPAEDSAAPGGTDLTILESDTGVTFTGTCDETAEGRTATVKVSAALTSSVVSTDGTDVLSASGVASILSVSSAAAGQEQATFTIVEPNGRTLQGIAYASVGAQGRDCVFAVSLFEAIG
jgi:hypothetical protein